MSNSRTPSKSQVDKLVQTFAIYREASKANLPIAIQTKLYTQYRKALDKVLAVLCAHSLSDENQSALEAAATRWWNAQAVRGAGKHW